MFAKIPKESRNSIHNVRSSFLWQLSGNFPSRPAVHHHWGRIHHDGWESLSRRSTIRGDGLRGPVLLLLRAGEAALAGGGGGGADNSQPERGVPGPPHRRHQWPGHHPDLLHIPQAAVDLGQTDLVVANLFVCCHLASYYAKINLLWGKSDSFKLQGILNISIYSTTPPRTIETLRNTTPENRIIAKYNPGKSKHCEIYKIINSGSDAVGAAVKISLPRQYYVVALRTMNKLKTWSNDVFIIFESFFYDLRPISKTRFKVQAVLHCMDLPCTGVNIIGQTLKHIRCILHLFNNSF